MTSILVQQLLHSKDFQQEYTLFTIVKALESVLTIFSSCCKLVNES